MTILKTPSTLVGTGSSPIDPRLDGFEGWPEASGSLGRPGAWFIVMQSDFDREGRQ
jgi:hypothetical protein